MTDELTRPAQQQVRGQRVGQSEEVEDPDIGAEQIGRLADLRGGHHGGGEARSRRAP